jgi:hypothetical protein
MYHGSLIQHTWNQNGAVLIKYSELYNSTVTVPVLIEMKVMRISRQLFPVQIVINEEQLENVECLNYLGSVMTSSAR